jgi:TPR repeat protein
MLRHKYKLVSLNDIDEEIKIDDICSKEEEIKIDDICSKEEEIIKYLKNNNYKYVKIDEKLINKIYNLLINNKDFKREEDVEYLYYGVYYFLNNRKGEMVNMYEKLLNKKRFYNKYSEYALYGILNLAKYYENENDFEKSKKYYLLLVNNNFNKSEMYSSLGYFEFINGNNKMMEINYLKSIELDNCNISNYFACINLSEYYKNTNITNNIKKAIFFSEKALSYNKERIEAYAQLGNLYGYVDIEKSKEYILKTIEKGDIGVGNYNLALYYYDKGNYKEMKKHLLIAINEGYTDAMNELGYYYKSVEKDYNKMKHYYLMAIEKGNIIAMNNLGYYYANIENNKKLAEKYYLMAINSKLDTDNHYYKLEFEKSKKYTLNNYRCMLREKNIDL